MNKKNLIIILPLLLLAFLLGAKKFLGAKTISISEAETVLNEYFTTNPFFKGVELKELTKKNDYLYEATIAFQGSEIPNKAYISKDGDYFFPAGFEIAATDEASENATSEPKAITDVTKSDKPVVELFVMSHCPFGTQIEKGILPVVNILGDKMDFQLKFVDYAMHGETELKEQMTQYCIDQADSAQFLSYLDCFLDDSDSDRCVTKVGVDKTKLAACMDATDKKFNILAGFKDKANWRNGNYPNFDVHFEDGEKYGVGGSPTLVINGDLVGANRDSASLLEAVCSAFNTRPEECDTELSDQDPGAGFRDQASGSGGTATCD